MANNETTDRADSVGPIANNNSNGAFRRFILDPKTSVKSYLAESLVENHQYNNPQGNQLPYQSSAPSYSHQTLPIDHPHQYESEQAASLQGYQTAYSQPQNASIEQDSFQHRMPHHSSSSYELPFSGVTTIPDVYQIQHQNPSYGAPQHLEQLPPHIPQPYQSPPPPEAPVPASSPPPLQHPQAYPTQRGTSVLSEPSSFTPPQKQNAIPHSRYGPAPPPADSLNATVLAPRTYHRMVVNFETLKLLYYTAKAQPHHIDLSAPAAKLKSLAREIWTMRFTRAQEFEYSDSAHEQIITVWKTEFELWSDVLEDLADPEQSRKDAVAELENDFFHLTGLDSPVALPATVPVKQAVAKAVEAAPVAAKKAAAPVAEDAAAKPVVKKVAKAAVIASGEVAKKPVVKKKVAVKPAA
ncbi:hypothetical protein K469DRAFT_748832 [Zopfia rhizophila CBS 207.26]|uniref:Uncharacterized protein n=1 Tax=Zopfia rhizophila CBS 207.26 TaxID=1314779 RepID=A0A6A6E9S8_9PEZI|nr:hypothetical protein K469DRAFT_748832 [Zopfia rhizophila CBS 207.26]